MNLLYPSFLIFGILLIIPIIIHLFNLRKFRTVYYSDTQLLEEIVLKTKRKKTIKELLLLFIRILVIIVLTLSFCYPYFIEKIFDENSEKALFIDNSKSVDVFSDGIQIFDNIKETSSLINSKQTKLIFLSNDKKVLNSLNSQEVRELIRDSRISSLNLPLSEVVELSQLKSRHTSMSLYSAFSKSFDLSGLQGVEQNLQFIHFDASSLRTGYIDSVWVEVSAKSNEKLKSIIVDYKTFGDDEKYHMKLLVNGELRGSQEVSNKSGQLKFTTHFSEIMNKSVVICYDEGGAELSSFYFTVTAKRDYKVTMIGVNSNSPLIKAFADKDDFIVYNALIHNIDFDKLYGSDLVFINYDSSSNEVSKDIIRKLLDRQIKVCIFFKNAMDNTLLKEFDISVKTIVDSSKISVKMPNSDFYHGVFMDSKPLMIDLPMVDRKYSIYGLTHSLLQNEFKEVILAQSIMNSNLYISTENLSVSSSFTRHSLFIPTVYQFLFYNNIENNLFVRPNDYYKVPQSLNVLDKLYLKIHLDSSNSEVQLIAQGDSKLIFLNQNLQSGFYRLGSDSVHVLLAINEKKSAGDYDYYSLKELKEMTSSFPNIEVISSEDFVEKGDGISDLDESFPIWKYFIVLALLLLGIEIILLKFKS
jgi:hypothetical protein